MEIEILDYTPSPVELISKSMGTCYGKSDTNEKRVKRAFVEQHMSVFEHAKVTVRISGVSRALSHQLVRHRMASFCQESQRYVKVDVSEDWFVKPEFDDEVDEDVFDKAMQFSAWAYAQLINNGVPAEDARYVLPNACKTTLVMTTNLRELYHFLYLREDSHAQWEIRDLAKALREEVSGISDEWSMLMSLGKQDDTDQVS